MNLSRQLLLFCRHLVVGLLLFSGLAHRNSFQALQILVLLQNHCATVCMFVRIGVKRQQRDFSFGVVIFYELFNASGNDSAAVVCLVFYPFHPQLAILLDKTFKYMLKVRNLTGQVF